MITMSQQPQVPELTVAELLDQPWIKRAGRVAGFLAVISFAGTTGYFFSLGNRITAIEIDRTKRIAATDQNTNSLRSQVLELQVDMDRVRSDVTAVKVDVGLVKGILQQMQKEQLAVAQEPPPAKPMPLLAVQN